MVGIYRILNTKNGKCYVGCSKNIYKRWEQHKTKLDNGVHHSQKLQNTWNRYNDKTVFKFEILEECPIPNLFEREKFYIEKFDSFKDGYNMTPDAFRVYRPTNKRRIKLQQEVQDLLNKFGFEFYVINGSHADKTLKEIKKLLGMWENLINSVDLHFTELRIDRMTCNQLTLHAHIIGTPIRTFMHMTTDYTSINHIDWYLTGSEWCRKQKDAIDYLNAMPRN